MEIKDFVQNIVGSTRHLMYVQSLNLLERYKS